LLVGILLSLLASPARAVVTEELIMVRSEQGFPETMSTLQAAIKQQGYTTSRVQRVDIGLTASGYKTDKYRVVFFGKADEMHRLIETHPEFIPYLPLKIAIFAEGPETILITSNPLAFIDLYPSDDMEKIFRQWKKDVVQILKSVQFPD
jgi:uncharacterized protein (DUF302 family)